jgi:hypothetical protein
LPDAARCQYRWRFDHPIDSERPSMSFSRLHVVLMTAWMLSVVAAIAVFFGAGLPGTWPQSAALFVLGCAPVAILLAIFHGAPPQTIAQILYDTDQSATGIARRRLHEARPTEIDLL